MLLVSSLPNYVKMSVYSQFFVTYDAQFKKTEKTKFDFSVPNSMAFDGIEMK